MEENEGFIEHLYALFMQLPIVIRWMLLIITVVGFIYKIWPSLVNYVCRPKLHIEFKKGNHLTFTKAGKKDKYIEIPCLSIRNDTSKTLKIISSSVMLGNNKIPTGSGEIIRKLYENRYTVKKNQSYQFMYEHYNIENEHTDIIAGRTFFSIESGHTAMFPLACFGTGPTGSFCIKSFPKKSLLIPFENKISISLNIDGKDREYAISKLSVYETYINYINGCESRDHIESYVSMMIFHRQKINEFLASINEKNL